jgi:hypothetical protein
MSSDDLIHVLRQFGPFLLILAWGAMVAIFRRRPPAQPLDTPEPVQPARRPPLAVPAPIAAAYRAVGRTSAPQPAPLPAPQAPPPRLPAAPPTPDPLPAVASRAEMARAASVARVRARDQADTAEAAATRLRAQLAGEGWQRAVVLTEILGPPIALRRPGTLGPPGAL